MKFLTNFLATLCLPALLFAQPGKPQRALFDNKTVGEIRLTLPVKNWGDALDSMRIYGDGMMLGKVTVDGNELDSIGVRFRGNASYQMGLKRNPFHIKLNYQNAANNVQGFTSLKLSAALRDPSMVREMLFYEVAGKYMPAPQVSYSKLWVNDEYIGVFVNVEAVDKGFARRHFGSDAGAFFKAGQEFPSNAPTGCRQNIFGSLEYEADLNCYKTNYEAISDGGWTELQEFTRILNQDPRSLEKWLDVDRALWMLALNNVMVNLSSYTGNYSVNYYLYRDDNGRFQPIHWDLNLAFGSYKNIGSGSDLELKDLQKLSPTLHSDNPLKPLVSQLLKDPIYKKTYLAHVRQILTENFSNGWYEKRAAELQGMILQPLGEDKFKTYTVEEFQRSLKETIGRRSRIPGLTELMGVRAKFLRNHPELTSLPSAVSEVNVASRAKFENQHLRGFHLAARADRFPKRMEIFYRFDASKPYQVMPMSEEAAPTGTPSGVKLFSANIEAKSESDVLDYYILVENAGTVDFSPSNYVSKPYMVKLADINK